MASAKLEYIMARVDEAKKRDAHRDTKWNDLEALVYRKHEISVPQALVDLKTTIIKTALLNEARRVIVASLVSGQLQVQRPRQGSSQDDQRVSSLIEKFVYDAIYTMDMGQGQHSSIQDTADNTVMFGLGINKLLYLPDAWDTEEWDYQDIQDEQAPGKSRTETPDEYNKRLDKYKQEAPWPFVWLTPDPRTYHPFYRDRELVEVLEISKRTRADLADGYAGDGVGFRKGQDGVSGRLFNARFGDPMPDSEIGSGSLADSVDFVEHWQLVDKTEAAKLKSQAEKAEARPRHATADDAESNGRKRRSRRSRETAVVTYIADGAILRQIDTGYSRLPYFPFFGIATASRFPEYECQGALDDLAQYIPSIDQHLTQLSNATYMAAYSMLIYKYTPPSDKAGGGLMPGAEVQKSQVVIPNLEWKPMKSQTLMPGEELGWMGGPPISPELFKYLDVVLRLADRAGNVPDVMKGQMEKAGIPAWGLAQLYTYAKRVIYPMAKNLADSISSMAAFMLELIDTKIDGKVYLQTQQTEDRTLSRKALGIGPDEIDGYYDISVELVTLTEQLRIMEAQLGLQLWAGGQGPITLRSLLEDYLHIQAPEEMMDERKIEQFEASPEYQQWERQRWFQRHAIPEMKALGATPEQIAQVGGAMGALPPGAVPPGALPPGALPPGALPPGAPPMGQGAQAIPGAPSPLPPQPGQGLPLTPSTPPGLPMGV